MSSKSGATNKFPTNTLHLGLLGIALSLAVFRFFIQGERSAQLFLGTSEEALDAGGAVLPVRGRLERRASSGAGMLELSGWRGTSGRTNQRAQRVLLLTSGRAEMRFQQEGAVLDGNAFREQLVDSPLSRGRLWRPASLRSATK
jgi:hypothetical protein